MTNYLERLTLNKILWIGLFFRVLASVFSEGYAFTDDHFEVVEIAQLFVDKVPNPFPELAKGEVYLSSLIYPGIHYLIFIACDALHISNPESQMLLTRLLHALFSMLGIYYGYKLTERLSNRPNDAKIVGLLLAIFWVFPFMSVRNLREFACIPPLLIGTYLATEKNLTFKHIIWAAFWFSIAFILRYQAIFIPFVFGLTWLLSKQNWTKAIVFGLTIGLVFMLIQGVFDYFYWGSPIASLKAYTDYNSNPANIAAYPNGPWHRYIGTVAGLFLGFPVLIFAAGYFKTFSQKGHRQTLFLASLLFFVFHSYYANKQERFILPFVPYFIILGIIGFRDIYEQYQHKKWLKNFTSFSIIWFLVLNTAFLMVLSVTYTKRSRVESMNYLREKGDLRNLVIQNYESPQPEAPFYLNKRYDFYTIDTPQKMLELPSLLQKNTKRQPNYVILVGNTDLEKRRIEMQKVFPSMKHEIDIEPSFVDNLAYVINPTHNHNETFYIYKIE